MLAKTGQVAILLRESDGTDKNPYDQEEREEEIHRVLVEEEGFDYDCFEVFYVPNIVNITYGRDVGYKIEEETFDKEIEDISATKIRQERGL